MIKAKCIYCNNQDSKPFKHGYHLECFKLAMNIKDINSDFEELLLKEGDGKSGNERLKRITTSTFYHGAFKKYSAKIENKKFILKIREKDYPELPQIEYLSNKIAQALGIEVAPYLYIKFNNKIPAFCTQNVLDYHDKGNLVHIWHYLIKKNQQNELEELTLKNIIKIILTETSRPIDIKKFIEISLFDMIIGNGDRHGRNLALIEKQGKKILSPAYDNPSNIGIIEDGMLGVDLRVKGRIYTDNNREPTLKDYIEEFEELGYKKICDDFMKKAINLNYKEIIEDRNINVSNKRKKAFFKLIQTNLEGFKK